MALYALCIAFAILFPTILLPWVYGIEQRAQARQQAQPPVTNPERYEITTLPATSARLLPAPSKGAAAMSNELPMWASDPKSSYTVGKPRPGAHVLYKDAPTLPGMPNMLPEEPTEAAVTAAALQAMAPGAFTDDSREKAVATGVRVIIFAAIVFVLATFGYGVSYLIWQADLLWLLVAWVAAAVLTMAYLLSTEGAARRYSAAGIEHAKIDAAVELHKDRLDSRERMHAQATQAWENVLTEYMRTWREKE